jgi:hypothetical protein
MKKIHLKKIDWKYWKHWLKCTINDLPGDIWYIIRYHYIALIAVSISIFIMFMDWEPFIVRMIVSFFILMFGMGYDSRNSTAGMY